MNDLKRTGRKKQAAKGIETDMQGHRRTGHFNIREEYTVKM
jgi:hypothetical protein